MPHPASVQAVSIARNSLAIPPSADDLPRPRGLIKLVHAGPESPTLRRWLDERAEIRWISSVLTEIESFRALPEHAPDAVSRLPVVPDQIDVIGRTRAFGFWPAPSSHHSALLDAVRAAGLPVDSQPDDSRRHRHRARQRLGTEPNPP